MPSCWLSWKGSPSRIGSTLEEYFSPTKAIFLRYELTPIKKGIGNENGGVVSP